MWLLAVVKLADMQRSAIAELPLLSQQKAISTTTLPPVFEASTVLLATQDTWIGTFMPSGYSWVLLLLGHQHLYQQLLVFCAADPEPTLWRDTLRSLCKRKKNQTD